jgi:maltose/moltooligosaccharide transporter
MPKLLWQLALVYLFQWYALFCYWQFITPMLKWSLYGISENDEQKQAKSLNWRKAEFLWQKKICPGQKMYFTWWKLQ